MNFFILIHSVSSLVCLKKLVEKGFVPGLVVSHKLYELDKLKNDFYNPLEKYCKTKKIRLIQSDSPKDIKKEIEDYETGICVGYMKILRKDFFDIPKHGIYNLHCGKLPDYRGRAPISRTIMNGDNELIATLHKMDEGVDSGPIAVETKIKITSKDDVNTLYKKFSENSYKSIVELLKKLKQNKLKLTKQKRTAEKANTILTDEECRINWRKGSKEIFNKVRALKAPYPQAQAILNYKKYFINEAVITNRKSLNNYGIIEKISDEYILVNTKDKIIKLSKIYSENKRVIIKKEFQAGDRF